MDRINKFLKYFGLFLLLAFTLSMFVVMFFYVSSPESFCYEVFEDDRFLMAGDFVIYDNVSSCVLAEQKVVTSKKSFYRSKGLLVLVCFIGYFLFSTDFKDGLKDKLGTKR